MAQLIHLRRRELRYFGKPYILKKALSVPFMIVLLMILTTGNSSSQQAEEDDPGGTGIDAMPPAPPAWLKCDYPASSMFEGVDFDESTHQTAAPGSDIWPITWADDGHQYAVFGDGGGFGGNNTRGRVSMGVSCIEGTHLDYIGRNVWGGYKEENPAQFTGKGTGILCVDGVLYMWVSGSGSKVVSTSQLAVSRDHARTWERLDWRWSMRKGLSAGVFVQAGQDYSGAPDSYIYAYFTRVDPPPGEPRGWIHEKPGRVDLARCPKSRLTEQAAWEWFAGRDETDAPVWTNSLSKRQYVFEDPNGIKVVSACYQPDLERYLLVYTPRDTGGNFALFESPHPWGPWAEVAYLQGHDLFLPPRPNSRVSIYHFAPKWWSKDGKEFTLVYNVGDDAWNTVRGRLLTK